MCRSLAINPNISRRPLPGDPMPPPPQPGQTTGPDDVKFEPDQGCIKNPLVIFIGGFADVATKNVCGWALEYQNNHHTYQDVYYREHSQANSVKRLVELYKQSGQKTAVIGHSWGGCTAARDVALKTTSEIDLLVTLDPVSCRKPNVSAKPANIKQYINIYIDYSIAKSDQANTIARVGGPWESVNWADSNHNIIRDTNIQFTHAYSWEMFEKYALQITEAIK